MSIPISENRICFVPLMFLKAQVFLLLFCLAVSNGGPQTGNSDRPLHRLVQTLWIPSGKR